MKETIDPVTVTRLWEEYDNTFAMVDNEFPKHLLFLLVASLLEELSQAALSGDKREFWRIREERLMPILLRDVDIDSSQQSIAHLTAEYRTSFDSFRDGDGFPQHFQRTEVRMPLKIIL